MAQYSMVPKKIPTDIWSAEETNYFLMSGIRPKRLCVFKEMILCFLKFFNLIHTKKN